MTLRLATGAETDEGICQFRIRKWIQKKKRCWWSVVYEEVCRDFDYRTYRVNRCGGSRIWNEDSRDRSICSRYSRHRSICSRSGSSGSSVFRRRGSSGGYIFRRSGISGICSRSGSSICSRDSRHGSIFSRSGSSGGSIGSCTRLISFSLSTLRLHLIGNLFEELT